MKKPISSENFRYISTTKTFFITLSELRKKTGEAINNIGLKISNKTVWFDNDLCMNYDEEGKETYRTYSSLCKKYKIFLVIDY